jgi:hypothetical protein
MPRFFLFILAFVCLAASFDNARAQVVIPFPPLGGERQKTKPKSAADLLREEAAKPPSENNAVKENQEMANDFLQYYSHGWFPTAFATHSFYFFRSSAWIINDANNISFPSLPRINSTFSPRNPYRDNELRRPLPRGDSVRTGEFYDSQYDDINIMYELALPLPAILRFRIGYAYQRGVLFAQDRSFNGLDPRGTGERIALQEIHTLDAQEHFLLGSFGVKIPVYGAFADLFDQRLSSYYYFYAGAQGQYNVFNRAVQHSQLVQPSHEFRYGFLNGRINGTDTVQVWNAPMPALNALRIQPEIAIGWGLSGEVSFRGTMFGLATMMEIFGTIPLQTVTSDAPWRQYLLGFRAALGWHRRL